ncbi:MAG: hypothetical protein ACE366_17005 [Bradymonadia bacterium]
MRQNNPQRAMKRWSARGLITIVALLAGASTTLAQGPQIERSFERASRLSNDQKMQSAVGDIEKMKGVLDLAFNSRESASEKKDFVQLNCISDKLSAIKGLLKIAEQADVSMREAIARGDQELIDHEFTKISIAAVRAENFRVEISGCVGASSQYTGDTQVERIIDEAIRTDQPDEQAALTLPPIELDRPTVVSPDE